MRAVDREKFVRLANKRVPRALEAIRLIGNLSNRSNYDYTDADVEKIFAALSSALKECHEKFKDNSKKDSHFSLS